MEDHTWNDQKALLGNVFRKYNSSVQLDEETNNSTILAFILKYFLKVKELV